MSEAPPDDQPAATIPQLLARTVGAHGDHAAICDGGSVLTYGELASAAKQFGAGLVASGVEAGDRVAIWSFNCTEWVVAALGIWHAGAVLVPINTRFKGAEAAPLLQRTAAKALVTVTDFLDTNYVALLAATGAELPALETVIVARGPVPSGSIGWDDFLGRATSDDLAEVERRVASLSADDPSDILFTSGTTGTPKGVVMTHGRTLAIATDWVAMTGLRAGDRYLMVNPYFHMFGLKAGILASTAAGATMYPEPVFDVERALQRVAAEQITIFPGAPTIYRSILDHPERGAYDLSSLRVAVTGAADIPVELIRQMRAELPFELIITGYGLTEAGTVSGTAIDDGAETVATTVGRPRPGYQVRVVDTDLRDVPAGEPGEVLVRSQTVMAGYLDDPAATTEAITDGGWLRTGDLGVVDARSCLRIVGRSKDMFIVGGFNAYPAEIENLLLVHPDVDQVAVIGVPDDRLGEVGMAFVVSRSSDPDLATKVLAWSRDQMANYKVPRAIEIIDALPINATGKVVKDELRDRVASPALLHRSLSRAAKRFGDKDALRFGDDAISFADLDRRSTAFAHHLAWKGVGRGDRVAIMSTNRPEFVVAVNAISKLGAASVLLSPAWKTEVAHAVDLTGARHAVADAPGNELLTAVLGADAVTDLDAAVWDAPTATNATVPWPPAKADDDAIFVFSSGTTGLPKAVRHTHASMHAATGHWCAALGLGPDDRFQVATPPSHILGLLNLLAAAEAGVTVRLHPRFDLDEVLRCIESERMTLEMAVAPIALAMANHPSIEDHDLSSLRYIMWGATPVTESVAETVTRRTGVRFLPAYGASELPVLACNPINQPDAWRLDSAGLPPTGAELRAVDLDSGAVLAPGEIGEIQARSSSVMAGYLPDEANAAAFDNGWYRTGDVGWLEAEGWVHLTDRSKEMIKVNGFQVAPAEIEAVLHGHPSVLDCAVFGIEDPRAGEVPVAAVALDPERPASTDELRQVVADALATYKHLRHLVVVDTIPRLPSGKVLRRTLRDEWAPKLASDAPAR